MLCEIIENLPSCVNDKKNVSPSPSNSLTEEILGTTLCFQTECEYFFFVLKFNELASHEYTASYRDRKNVSRCLDAGRFCIFNETSVLSISLDSFFHFQLRI